jgi:hypothetical protein
MSFREFLQTELNESSVDVQVTDQKETLKNLAKAGIKAKAAKLHDEVTIDLHDKKKVKAWMLDMGWDMEDLEELYPEVL